MSQKNSPTRVQQIAEQLERAAQELRQVSAEIEIEDSPIVPGTLQAPLIIDGKLNGTLRLNGDERLLWAPEKLQEPSREISIETAMPSPVDETLCENEYAGYCALCSAWYAFAKDTHPVCPSCGHKPGDH